MNFIKQMAEDLINQPVSDEDVVLINYLGHDITSFEKDEVEWAHNYVKSQLGKELNKEDILYARWQAAGHSDYAATFAYEVSKLLQ